MSIKLLLVDDHKMLREGLAAMLANESDFNVVGEASDGHTALRLDEELKPDVIILDISLPDISGATIMRRLANRSSAPKVVVLSMYTDDRFVSELLEAGASAYVIKSSAFAELARAIRAALRGQMYLSPEITKVMVTKYRQLLTDSDKSSVSQLTVREREVARLLANGRSTVEIADALAISPKTVATHRKNLMDKLGLRSVADVTKFAIKEGLVGVTE